MPALMNILPCRANSCPAAFVSVGNADPLAAQYRALASHLAPQGTDVMTLFFPPDHVPPQALTRAVARLLTVP
jgi:acetyl esterase